MRNSLIENHKNMELKKHVNAIHCSNNLTLVQRKLFNVLLFNAYADLPYKQRFEIRSNELSNLIGYNSKDTAKLKNALLGLIQIAVEWNVIDGTTGQDKRWKASSVLASAELSKGVCIYEYSQVMREFLYHPEIYGRINIDLVSKFKSSYGLALYENCIRYRGLPQTPWFSLDAFKKLMGILGDKYQEFKDFKKRVLDIAVKEVNAISPIRISTEIERVNKRVEKLRFKIHSQTIDDDCEKIEIPTVDHELHNLLVNTFGLSQQMMNEIFTKYDNKFIKEKIAVIQQSDSFISGKIRGLAGYLVEALRKDYKHSKSSKLIIEDEKRKKEKHKEEEKSKEKRRQEQYKNYETKKISSYLEKMSKSQEKKLMLDFNKYLQNQHSIIQGWYQKHKLDHPATKAAFNIFLKESKSKQLGIISYEDFIELLD